MQILITIAAASLTDVFNRLLRLDRIPEPLRHTGKKRVNPSISAAVYVFPLYEFPSTGPVAAFPGNDFHMRF